MTIEQAYDQYDDYLDETNTKVTIAGITFYPSHILKDLDPIAYECGFSDFCNAEGIDPDELE